MKKVYFCYIKEHIFSDLQTPSQAKGEEHFDGSALQPLMTKKTRSHTSAQPERGKLMVRVTSELFNSVSPEWIPGPPLPSLF